MTASIGTEFLALQELLAGRYSIERELAVRYGDRAARRDVALDRPVRDQAAPPHLATQAHERDRFLQEARTAAGLAHPKHRADSPRRGTRGPRVLRDGLRGWRTLRDRVERAGPLPPRLATKLMQEVAWALGAAHQRGVIHRDVKPDNIMIERATERAVVTDFGIALRSRAGKAEALAARSPEPRAYEPGAGVAASGGCAQRPLLPRRDVLLRPHRPGTVRGRKPPAIITKQRLRDRATGPAAPAEVPAKLGGVVDRLLRKAPSERFQTADDLARVAGELRGRDFRRPAAAARLRAERASLHPGPVDVVVRWEAGWG